MFLNTSPVLIADDNDMHLYCAKGFKMRHATVSTFECVHCA